MFKKFLKRKEKSIDKYTYYETLDEIPLYNWVKIYTEKELKYLIRNIDYRIFENSTELNAYLEVVWEKVYDEYLEAFGLNEKYKRILELERKIALLRCEIWLNDNKFKRNEIRIAEKKLEREKKNDIDEKGNDYTKQVVLIEKWLNASLDMKKISAKKYYTYLDIIQDEAKKVKMKDLKENGTN